MNSPINLNDPTGHWECKLEPDECEFLEDHNSGPTPPVTPPGGDSGGGGRSGNGGDHPLVDIFEKIIFDDFKAMGDNDCYIPSPETIDWTNSKCIDAVSFLFQDIATLSSSASALWTTTLTAFGCAVEGIGCAVGYGLGVADHLMFFNPLESTASGISFGLTIYSDWLTHDTYVNSLTDWGVGEDTKTGLATFAAGSLIVESFADAGIDIYASGYNHGYFCGISTLAACIGSMIINASP